MLKALIAGMLAILLAATAVAGVSRLAPIVGGGAPVLLDEEEEEETEDAGEANEDADEADAGDGPPPGVEEMVGANRAHAAERARAARDHAAAIMAWTSCIAANAANPDDLPRDDTFDPKVGCEDLRPAPPTDPNDPEVEVEDDGAGPPEGVGPPEGAGPPDWVPGPPPFAGPGGAGEQEDGEAP